MFKEVGSYLQGELPQHIHYLSSHGYLMDQKLGPSESVRWLVWFPSPACLLLAQCLQVPLSLTWEVMPEGKEEARQIPLRLVL